MECSTTHLFVSATDPSVTVYEVRTIPVLTASHRPLSAPNVRSQLGQACAKYSFYGFITGGFGHELLQSQ